MSLETLTVVSIITGLIIAILITLGGYFRSSNFKMTNSETDYQKDEEDDEFIDKPITYNVMKYLEGVDDIVFGGYISDNKIILYNDGYDYIISNYYNVAESTKIPIEDKIYTVNKLNQQENTITLTCKINPN